MTSEINNSLMDSSINHPKNISTKNEASESKTKPNHIKTNEHLASSSKKIENTNDGNGTKVNNVKISDEAKNLAKAMKNVSETDITNTTKIKELQEQIKKGEFKINLNKIVDNLIELDDNLSSPKK